MKRIGILGGMSAASTQLYYAQLCELVGQRLGGLHSPELLIRSIDFAPMAELQAQGDWETAGEMLNREMQALVAGGAEILLLATNTMHKVAEEMLEGISVPFVHIGDSTARAIRDRGLCRPGLMATAFTMEQPFYLDRLRSFGLHPLVPESDDRAEVHRIIYDELCRGNVTDASRRTYEDVAARLVKSGADSLIFGCTEVGMLLSQDTVAVPVFDTVAIHCEAAIDAALAD